MAVQLKRVTKRQAGGPAEGGAPPAGGGNPQEQLMQLVGTALQSGDCNAALQACELIAQLVQGGGGGTPPPAPAPGGGAPPAMRNGGFLNRR